MTDKENEKRPSGLRRRLIAVSMLLLCLAAALLLCLSLYLNGSHAPRLLSRILTDYLQQPLTVDTTALDGDLLSLRGVSLANPTGTAPGYLCRVDTLTIAPDWGGLLRGKRSLRLLALSGIRIDLRRNRSGVWNFSPLQRQLASRKSSGSELSIASLRISDGAISIDGRQLRGLNLRLTDLTTKGSNEARLELSFRDPGRNRYTLAGTLRPGTEPALDLTLSAPSISPVSLAAALGLKSSALLTESRAGVSMNASLHGKKFQTRGSLNFTALTPAHATPRSDVPKELNGRVDLAASYDMAEERAQLESLELKLNDRVAGHATASLERVRTLRRFSVDMNISRVELNRLGFLLPKKERERTRISGSLESGGIHLEGDGQQGVRKASGSVMLRGASLRRDGRLIFDRLDAPVSLSRSPGGFLLKGSLVRRGKGGEALLESLEAPFQVVLTSRLKLEGARIPRLSAGIMGISVNGRGGLEPASTNPLNASLKISAPSLPRVVSLAGLSGLAIGSGACSLSLDAAGRGVRDFAAKAMLVLSSMTGTRGTHSFTLGEGRLDSRPIMSRGALRASGTGRLNALAVDKKSGEGRFDFEFSGKTVRLRDAQARMDKTSLSIGAVELMLPVREKVGGRVRTPLSIRITTGVISREELRMEGISGMLQTDLVSEAASKWLEGRGECTVGGITWKGKRLGNPKLLLSFSRPGARGELGGTLLGGTLDGKFDVDPFAVSRGVNFRGGITGAQAAIIGELLPRRVDARLSSGTLGGELQRKPYR